MFGPSFRTRHRIAATAIAVSAVAGSLVAPLALADQVQFRVEGSTQMYTLGALLARQYSATINQSARVDANPTTSQAGYDTSCQDSTAVGMSDVYIQDNQLREPGCADMMNIPVAISATPVVYNLPGAAFNARAGDGFTLAHPVKLTAQIIARIYFHTIKFWNDRAIAALNPTLKLPTARIRVAVSSEPGGSGYVFSQWLSRSDRHWASRVGESSLLPSWPAGSIGEGSGGQMVQFIQSTPYSIGFVGFDYAISNHLQAAALRNASGYFVTPSLNGLSAAIGSALRTIGMPEDFRRSFVTVKDAPGSNIHAFNPACFEFFVVHKGLHGLPGAYRIHAEIKKFLQWSIDSAGGQLYIEQIEFRKVGRATRLDHGFIPVPEEIRRRIARNVASISE